MNTMKSLKARSLSFGYVIVLLTFVLAACGSDEDSPAEDAGFLCEPLVECGPAPLSLRSQDGCPEALPSEGEACSDLSLSCYYCTDPAAETEVLESHDIINMECMRDYVWWSDPGAMTCSY